MSLFDIDYNALVKILLPQQLRNANMKAWLNSLVSPVVYVYNLFMGNRYDNLYVLNHSSQVTYLQAVLNDAFDNALRRIIIVDGPDFEPVYTYLSAEEKAVFIYKASENLPTSLYTNNETVTLGYDFIVLVPSSIAFDPSYMNALIQKFKLASKTYTIKTV